jgi:DNA-binding transcriptional LysR family regulator
MDRLDAMSTFVAVCDAGGFAAAARRLDLSPSAVTRAVGQLEARLGARLLERSTRSMRLTDAGRLYLERSRRVLAEVEEAELSVQGERAEPRGRLVVSAPLVFGRLHVTPLFSDFLLGHSQLSGELILSDRYVNLIEDGVDAAVRIGTLPDSSLIARRVGQVRRVLVASPAYLERRGVPTAPAELGGHNLIAIPEIAGRSEWRFERDGAEVRIGVEPRLTTSSVDAALWHTLQDGGLAIVLSYQARELVREGRLRVVMSDWEPPVRPIHLVHPSSRLLSAKVRAFSDLVASQSNWGKFSELEGPG